MESAENLVTDHWLIDKLSQWKTINDWLIDKLTAFLTDWLTDSLSVCVHVRPSVRPLYVPSLLIDGIKLQHPHC